MLKDGSRRKKWAPLLFLAAGLGAVIAIDGKLPRTRNVVLDLGHDAHDVTDIELTWTQAGTSDEAALTTRWHFAPGQAPEKVRFEARLADGAWDVEAAIERTEKPQTTRWPYRVNLEGSMRLVKDARDDTPVVLPVRNALR